MPAGRFPVWLAAPDLRPYHGLVVFLLILFATRYRHGSKTLRNDPTPRPGAGRSVDGGTLLVFVGLAVWGADLYLRLYNPPPDALQIFVVGKQWMWKAQHPGGQREINELHVPAGQDIRLVIASQDVIHSFYVPALRIKQDVVPGRYETMWFRADKAGRYHLFCAEYCGTDHAHMGGWVTVMNPREYADWLRQQGGQQTLAVQGAAAVPPLWVQRLPRARRNRPRAAARRACSEARCRCPMAASSIADDRYIRDSILTRRGRSPQAMRR